MPHAFSDILFTPAVRKVQQQQGSGRSNELLTQRGPSNNRLGPDEEAFIESRDSFYQATTGESGWPYVQFRGGDPGFLRVLDEKTIGYIDVTGNRQYISTGNLSVNDKVAMILMDYAAQARLKIIGHVRVMPWNDGSPEAVSYREKLPLPDATSRPERMMIIDVAGFDWNCPQHITPRWTAEEIQVELEPLRRRVAELEAENKKLRAGE